MIHLLDRIYVEYAEAKPMPQNPLLAPEAYIRIIDRNLSGITDVDTQDKNLFNVKNVKEAYEKFGSKINLINHLLAQSNTQKTKKIIIYADEIATIQLLSSLWKDIYPKLTASGAYKMYISYKDFEYFKPKDQMNFIAFDEDSRPLEKKDFLDTYWGKTFEEFEILFNESSKFGLPAKALSKVSTEHLMIKYIINPEADHSSLFAKIDHFYKKNIMREVTGLITLVSEYLYNLISSEQKGENPAYLNNISAVDYLKKHPKYSLLLDDKIVYSTKAYEYLKSNYNLIKVCTDLVNAEAIALKQMDIVQEKKDLACSHYIIENHAEPDLKMVLNEEIFYHSNFRLFRELANKGRYNQYLVYSFAITKKQGTESLAEFSE